MEKNELASFVDLVNETLKNLPLEHDITECCNSVALTVKYPNVVIRNSLNLSKNLGDVYVSFLLSLESNGSIRMFINSVVRSFYESTDFFMVSSDIRMYNHSHINTVVSEEQNVEYTFCFGVSAIRFYYEGEGFNISELPHALVAFKKFLEWESIEGGPYTKFQYLSNKDNSLSNRAVEVYIPSLINSMLESNGPIVNPFNVDFGMVCDCIKVVDGGIYIGVTPERLATVLYNNNILKPIIRFDNGVATVHVNECSRTISKNEINKILSSLAFNFKGNRITPNLVTTNEESDLKNMIEVIHSYIINSMVENGINSKLPIIISINNTYNVDGSLGLTDALLITASLMVTKTAKANNYV